MTPPVSSQSWVVPELGPSLGRLIDPPAPSQAGRWTVPLDDIRLELVTGIFDVAGAARSFMASGDRESAVASLGRVTWLHLWERAVASAAQRIADAVNARFRAAAEESRLPPARLQQFLLKPEDVRAIESRLGSGGASFVSSLDALEQTVPAATASGSRGQLGQADWQLALGTTARRLEAAWMALTEAMKVEQDWWAGEIERVRAWRRPRWPLWITTAVLLLLLTYLGLVFGGYLPVPAPLRGIAEFWWSRL